MMKKAGYHAVLAKVCKGCKHFRLHYVKWGNLGYRELDLGHCVYPRLKNRRTDETCPHWTPREIKNEEPGTEN